MQRTARYYGQRCFSIGRKVFVYVKKESVYVCDKCISEKAGQEEDSEEQNGNHCD